MPERTAVDRQADIVAAARERLTGVMNIDFVTPDYFATYPKPCMGGWARDAFMVAPDGTVLPCHAAQTIPSLRFERFGERSLAEIWTDYGIQCLPRHQWMQEPCRSCGVARSVGRLDVERWRLPACRRNGSRLHQVADPRSNGEVHRRCPHHGGFGGKPRRESCWLRISSNSRHNPAGTQ
jgi:radical SAM protein with 4Fe4S-binding SPASM domain